MGTSWRLRSQARFRPPAGRASVAAEGSSIPSTARTRSSLIRSVPSAPWPWPLWAFAELLDSLGSLPPGEPRPRRRQEAIPDMNRAAAATAEFYLQNTCRDGIPMWDTGAPPLPRLGSYLTRPADPFNRWE